MKAGKGVSTDDVMVDENEAAEEAAASPDAIRSSESEGNVVPDIDVDAAERDLAERTNCRPVERCRPGRNREWLESTPHYVLESKGPERSTMVAQARLKAHPRE